MIKTKTKTLGVIGGLGPMATAYYMELVIQMTDASCDQEHLNMIISSRPGTPDRTRYILGLSDENPAPVMIDAGRWLVAEGAEILAIPCITAHYFQKQLEEEIHTPVIHLIKETVHHMRDYGVRKAGIMATDGTIQSGLFQEELRLHGMEAVLPSAEAQKKVMHLIYDNVKAGRPPELELFREVKRELMAAGAEVIVLGCTELSIIKKMYPVGSGVLDAMEVLAREAVLRCGAPLKQEYDCLITGWKEPDSERLPEEIEEEQNADKRTRIFGTYSAACAG